MSKPILLRGGFITTDPRLDRLPHFDDRSRDFPIRALIAPDLAPATKVWDLSWLLDQGQEGACTNFALAHNRLGSPQPKRLRPIAASDPGRGAAQFAALANFVTRVADAERVAKRLYGRSKELDPFPGEDYDGTTVLAACKAWREAGLLGSYRWSFGIDDLILALGHVGPAVLGTVWLDSMMNPGPTGLLDVTGREAGGHAYDALGVILQPEKSSRWSRTGVRGEPLIVGPNSWGPSRSPREPARVGARPWGNDGFWAMRASDVETLLRRKGEAVVPLDRLVEA